MYLGPENAFKSEPARCTVKRMARVDGATTRFFNTPSKRAQQGRNASAIESLRQEIAYRADQDRWDQPKRDDMHCGRQVGGSRMAKLLHKLVATVQHPMPSHVA